MTGQERGLLVAAQGWDCACAAGFAGCAPAGGSGPSHGRIAVPVYPRQRRGVAGYPLRPLPIVRWWSRMPKGLARIQLAHEEFSRIHDPLGIERTLEAAHHVELHGWLVTL